MSGVQHIHALAGQLYVDNLADNAKARAVRAMAGHVSAIKKAVKGAKTFTDMRKKLRRLHADADPAKLARVLERAIIMSELAGRRALYHEHT
jgi:phage gp29-like protein